MGRQADTRCKMVDGVHKKIKIPIPLNWAGHFTVMHRSLTSLAGLLALGANAVLFQPSRLRCSGILKESHELQWRVRFGFAPNSLFSPEGAPMT